MNYLSSSLVQGSLLLVVLTLLLSCFGAKLKPTLKLWLHKLVYLRFLFPGLFLAGISLPVLSEVPQEFVANSASQVPPQVADSLSLNSVTEVSVVEPQQKFSLFEFWLIGAVLLTLMSLYLSYRQAKRLRGRKPVGSEQVLDVLDKCCSRLGLSKKVLVSESAQLSSPVLYGFFKAEIILPLNLIEQLDESELEHVFLHELIHLKQGDNVWNLQFLTVQIMSWYNPLIWIFRKKTHELQEQACDAQVLNFLNDPKSYGLTLIKVLEHPPRDTERSLLGISCLVNKKQELKRRIKMIGKTYSKTAATLSVLIMALLSSTGFADLNQQEIKEQPNQAESEIAPVNEKQILIKSQFIQGDILSAPQVITEEGNTAVIRVVEERYFPEGWEKPELIDKNGKTEVVPAKPVFEDPLDLGIELFVTPSIIELPGEEDQIHLSGKVKLSKQKDSEITQTSQHMASKGLQNFVTATENQEAVFTLLTKAGKVSEIKMMYEGKPLTVKIEATIIKGIK